jgi:16S rRNA (guanine966-N2)-methyltransferase
VAGIRVIAGKAKGRKLKMVKGDGTRPITDRVKENLFNILGTEVHGSTFFDLFAGTGSVGIEALSRGAAHVLFMEISNAAIKAIQQNLEHTRLEEGAEVLRRDAFVFLRNHPDRGFDTIFIAPPQYKGMWERALLAIDENPGWLNPDGWAVVQIDPHEYKKLELSHLVEFEERKYGNTLLVFYEKPVE